MSVSAAPNETVRLRSIQDFLDRPGATFQVIVGATLLLLFFGLVMVLSASSVFSLAAENSSWAIFRKQALFAIAGLVVFAVALRIPLTFVRRWAWTAPVVSFILLGLTFTPLGLDIRGNRNWIPLFGGFNLQPSEFAKLGLVLWIAWIYALQHDKLPRDRQHLRAPQVLLPMAVVAGLMVAVVIAQKDLGTAGLLLATTVGMLFLAGLPMRALVAAVLGVVIPLSAAIWSEPHRIQRFLIFLNPEADPEHGGYQVIKGMMGFARGGFWGLGVGNSRQKWGALPDAHTDFILAIVGEELGLAGALVLLVLFLVLVLVGFRVATRSRDHFTRYLAAGVSVWIAVQSAVNIGMVLGTIPVIGVPLPLISYGGSSLIATLAGLGLLANCARSAESDSRGGKLVGRGRKV